MKNNLMVKIILAAAIIFSASIYLPDIFWSSLKFKSDKPRVSYSPVSNSFLLSYSHSDKNRIVDLAGKQYTRDQYDSLMPQLNFAQLVFAGKMFDSLKGHKVDVPILRRNLFRSSFEPFTINRFPMMLNPLIESKPGRVNLEYPFEFFNIKDRMKIIDSRTNKVIPDMSQEFTEALENNGFVFPAKKLFGNPTTRKAFDEGYFILDQADHLFHLKRVSDKPFCKKVDLPAEMKIVHFNLHELPLREFFGFFVTEDNKLYLLTYGDYKIVNIPIKNYEYNNSSINIFGDFFYRTFTISNENKLDVLIYDREYKLVDSYSDKVLEKHESTQGIVSAYIFPFTMSLINNKSMFVNFNLEFSDIQFIIVNILLFIFLVFFLRVKNYSLESNLFSLVTVLLTGLYGIIAVFTIRDFGNSNSFGAKE